MFCVEQNPGFAAGHLMTLVPGIVDDSIVFTKSWLSMPRKARRYAWRKTLLA